jgi:WD40 repeat protein
MSGPCPATDQLQRMLQDELAPTEAGPVEQHVTRCLACQQVLEELTHDSQFNVMQTHGGTEPGVSDFLQRMIESPSATVHRPVGLMAETVLTAQLQGPATQPLIPGYEILDELGHGGMGVVFRAREVRLNRIVALKMLLPGGYASPELVARFKGEAETVARLQHPNVVQIHSVGDHEGRPFFEMELVGGGSLAARLDGTPWHPREAARLVEAIARGVEAVHHLGVIHRDLKPSNVLMSADGSPKLGDFGLAKDLTEDSGMTRTNAVLGSPSYMAPEQAEGGSRRAGPASDVYSLGAVFYEVLTGRPPFKGATVLETLRQVRTAEPVAPSRLVPGLSRDAETIALKCLEKTPARRYGSAGELAEDLRRFVDHRPILARRTGPAGRLLRWGRRNPGMAGLTATIMLLLLAVTSVSLVAAIRVTTAAEKERRTLYFAQMNLTQLAWEASDVRRMRELLDSHRNNDLRSFEWFYWWRLAHRSAGELLGHQKRISVLAFSPDGRTLVSTGDDPSLIVWDPSRFEARTTLPMTIRASSLAVAPDGSTIAVGGIDGSIRIWKAGDLEPSTTLKSGSGPVMALVFVDQRTLVSAHAPNINRTWDLASGRLLRERQGSELRPARVHDHHNPAHAISADGCLVAVAALDGTVFVRPTGTGGPVRTGPVSTESARLDAEDLFVAGTVAARSLAFSPDGRLLAIGGEDHLITIRDVARREQLHTFRGHSASIWSMAFSPDGRLLAAASLDNTVSIWDIASERLTMTLKGHGGPVMALAFSPDGQSLASGSDDSTVKLWRVVGADSEAPLVGHTAGVQSVALAPDGSTLATGGRDGRLLFWSTATGERMADIESYSTSNPAGNSDYIEALVYSNDGRWLISAGRNGMLRLWDARTHAFLADLQGNNKDLLGIRSLAISRDDTLLASGRSDGTVTLWDIARRGQLTSYRGSEKDITSLSFSPDGRTLASASWTGKISLWDVTESRIKQTLDVKDSDILFVAFAPDGRTLASGTVEGSVVLWDVASWRPRATQRAHSNQVASLAFTPDGRTLVSGGRDDMIRLWDVASGELKSTLKGHTGNVVTLAISSDGLFLVSGSLDSTARIWRAASEDDMRRQERE